MIESLVIDRLAEHVRTCFQRIGRLISLFTKKRGHIPFIVRRQSRPIDGLPDIVHPPQKRRAVEILRRAIGAPSRTHPGQYRLGRFRCPGCRASRC